MIESSRETLRTSDGYEHQITCWHPEGTPRALLVALHGVRSHAGWYVGSGRMLAEAGIEVRMPDRRGSGANRADRGHAPSCGRLIADVLDVVETLRGRWSGRPLILSGISWGGKLAIAAAASRPDRVDGLALLCPGVEPRVGVPIAERLRIGLAFALRLRTRFPIPLSDPALFTADPDKQRFIEQDRDGLRDATADLLVASHVLDRVVRRAPPKVTMPCLLMLAEHDRIVNNDRTRAYFDRLAGADRTILEYLGAHHTLEFEPGPRTPRRGPRLLDRPPMAGPGASLKPIAHSGSGGTPLADLP